MKTDTFYLSLKIANPIFVMISILLVGCDQNKVNQIAFERSLIHAIEQDSVRSNYVDHLQTFENYLLEKKLLIDNNSESYLALIDKVEKDEVWILIDSVCLKYRIYDALQNPMNMAWSFQFIMYKLKDFDEELDENNSIVRLAGVQQELFHNPILSDKNLNERLINSVSEEDFKKFIYRIPALSMIYQILDHNYYKYHTLNAVHGIRFWENSVEMDRGNSDLDVLDSLCKSIEIENRNMYYFWTLVDEKIDGRRSIDLSKKRSKAFVDYIVETYKLSPRQVRTMKIHQTDSIWMHELIEKGNPLLLYKELKR
ncbi:MAG: hypothetical protein JEZ03_03035 [Bacteroidales bacterium]|nr:hypothetical protein [Bacteroidales bacterium]